MVDAIVQAGPPVQSDALSAAMVDSFVFQIEWTTVAMVIGLLASLIAVFSLARRLRDD
jgi:hypothetical protein